MGARVLTGGEPADVARLESTGARLRLDAAVAEVMRCLEGEGMRALLLKGPAVSGWLYPERAARVYLDCDLLLRPSELETAAVRLEAMGYGRGFDDRDMPLWWREHELALVRARDGVTVELHRWLPGVGLEPETAWSILWEGSSAVVVAGRRVSALGAPARALHVVLHAAQHGVEWGRPLGDLEQAVSQLDDDLWRQAYALAVRLDALEGFAAGLGLTEGGRRLASRLELPTPRSVRAVLCAASPPPVALGLEQLVEANGMRSRSEILLRKVVPPPSFMRHWDRSAGASRAALLRAYVRRPLWLLARLPTGLRAWRQARRSVNDA